ncbi:hypothetical protein WR25_27107 isoform F [Diploscapter pachys]|nr:hypothetical protein WR25_27107 isoform D [Diploscapter pachys]PAV74047.1 hypothetical protein WR25_27107 isoform F [Diploscapter pachys]
MLYLPELQHNSIGMIRHILLLFIVAPACTALSARGAPHAIILTAARTTEKHPLGGTHPITIWCAPDNPQVTISKATLTRQKDKKEFKMTVVGTKKNATYEIEKPTTHDAGEYLCALDTPYGKLDAKIPIYVRPLALSDNEHFTPIGDNEFILEGDRKSTSIGGDVNLTCPITGHPVPSIKWTKDSKPLELSNNVMLDGTTIRIKVSNESQAGLYSCEAVNEYSVGGKTSRLQLVVNKRVEIKSQMAWILPLAIIIIMFVLLILIIIACEARNRKKPDPK